MPFIADDPASWRAADTGHPADTLLDQMAELLADPWHWQKDGFSDGAGAYCLIGALYQVSRGEPEPPEDSLSRVELAVEAALMSGIEASGYEDGCADREQIYDFNDDDETDHAAILNVLRLARVHLVGSTEGES